MTTEESFDHGKGFELALPGDTIRTRHIATRASNRRRIIVLVEGDAEFEGYSIGLDDHSLQLLELPSGEVSSISLDHIVAITDGIPFNELTRELKDIVDRRTASFRKTSHSWLVKNWPNVYDRRDETDEASLGKTPYRSSYLRPPRERHDYSKPHNIGARSNFDVDSQVRDGAGQGGDQD